MELARRAQQMDLERVAADLAHDTSRAVEEPATDAEVQCELDDCATQRPLDEGRGKLCGLPTSLCRPRWNIRHVQASARTPSLPNLPL